MRPQERRSARRAPPELGREWGRGWWRASPWGLALSLALGPALGSCTHPPPAPGSPSAGAEAPPGEPVSPAPAAPGGDGSLANLSQESDPSAAGGIDLRAPDGDPRPRDDQGDDQGGDPADEASDANDANDANDENDENDANDANDENDETDENDDRSPRLERPEALAYFYAALARARDGHAIARVLHMGDSSIGMDGLPHAIRRRLQARFGDAGPGFLLVDRFSKNYNTKVATLEAEGWSICYIAYLCKKDGRYGLGGHSFRGEPGAWTRLRPPRGEFGREVATVEVWYAARPGGGQLRLRVDRDHEAVIDTRAETLDDRWFRLEVPPGEHTIDLRPAGGGPVRVYGVVLENDGPGVVWDTVSMTGAYVRRLHGYDDDHIAGQVAHRDPDLLAISYGGNDLRRFVSRSVTAADYKEEYRATIRKLRRGKPEASCLVIGVSDHARSGPHDVRPEHVAAMTAIEREVAAEEGCAFFDAVAAMGGPGSILRWAKEGKASPDLKHLSRRGLDLMGGMIYDAILAGDPSLGRDREVTEDGLPGG